MEFRILGPLEVADGDSVLALAGAKQLALLAILLLNANQVVSADRLIDQLWGDDPPDSGATALQVRISKLRKALGPAGELLQTRAPGYVLRVEPAALDLHRFERLCAEAEGAEPAVAAARLRAALALWRGPALADLAYEEFARPAIGRLEELRLSAVEKRIDAELALGRHADLAGELEALAREHPLRERLRGQQMLALYRAGRQAEALEAYREAREALVDGLGIEPSPPLQELEQAILRQDPALDLQAAAPPERSILVAPFAGDAIRPLVALAAALARRPARELVVARALADGAGLGAATAELHTLREQLQADGVAARGAAFTSRAPGDDAVRMASELDCDLLLVDAPPGLLDDPQLAAVLRSAPCDVGVLAGGAADPGPVLVPFGGAPHDWCAIELGAWLAGSWEAPLRLAGPTATSGRDASRLLASASLAVQRALGVAAEPLLLEPGTQAMTRAAAAAAITIVGLSDRWRRDGVGPVRGALAASGRPTILVRRGLRPGGLAPRENLTRFTWSLAPSA